MNRPKLDDHFAINQRVKGFYSKTKTENYVNALNSYIDYLENIEKQKKTDSETISSVFDLEECFKAKRFDETRHLGGGDIRLTIGDQEDIVQIMSREMAKK